MDYTAARDRVQEIVEKIGDIGNDSDTVEENELIASGIGIMLECMIDAAESLSVIKKRMPLSETSGTPRRGR